MYSELKSLNDYGANTLSSHVQVEELALNAFITFILSVNDKIFVGLGNGGVQSFPDATELKLANKKDFAARGLPICAAGIPSITSVLVGTDNGELLEIGDGLSTRVSLEKGWIEHIAVSASGAIAYSVNKTCYLLGRDGVLNEIPQPQGTISGLQFNAEGSTLAIARYGGVAIWDVPSAMLTDELEQKGAHMNLSWSPDDRYLVTATLDKEIHCWELSTRNSFRMRGYPSKIRSFCWSADGQHLAAAGADSVTVWPFVNGNPSGKPPYEFGYSFKGTVTAVAAHPSEAIIAAGYDNGTVLIGKYLKGEAIIARVPSGETISALAWSLEGDTVFAGTDTGKFSRIQLKALDF